MEKVELVHPTARQTYVQYVEGNKLKKYNEESMIREKSAPQITSYLM